MSSSFYVLQDVLDGSRCYGLEWKDTVDHKVGEEFVYGTRVVTKILTTNLLCEAQETAHAS